MRKRMLRWLTFLQIFLLLFLVFPTESVQADGSDPCYTNFLEGVSATEEEAAFFFEFVSEGPFRIISNGCFAYGLENNDISAYWASNRTVWVEISGTPTAHGICTVEVKWDKHYSTLTVNIEENVAPTAMHLSLNVVQENLEVNSIVGELSTTDVNNDKGDLHAYSLVGGDTASFNNSDSSLCTSAVFDYETKNSYSITVRSTEQGGNVGKIFQTWNFGTKL